jgi:SAM-dependent methyltransferase
MWRRFISGQLRSPSRGVFSWVFARLWNRRNSVLNDFAFDHLDLSARDRVLEVGFGGGYLLERMAQVVSEGFLAGVDVSEGMVAACKRRFRSLIDAGSLEVRCAQVESLPYPPGSFNKCSTVNSLFYWTNAQQGIAEIFRVLTDGGRFVTVFTCRQSLEDKSFVGDGISLYQGEDIRGMMEAVGFTIVEINQASDRYRDFHCIVGEK